MARRRGEIPRAIACVWSTGYKVAGQKLQMETIGL